MIFASLSVILYRNSRDCRTVLTTANFEEGHIAQVWPAPDTSISLLCYQQSKNLDLVYLEREGIGAIRLSSEIDIDWGSPPEIPLEVRTSLFVDGIEVQQKPSSLGRIELLADCDRNFNCRDTGRPVGVSLAWHPHFSIGQHEVKIVTTNDEGNDLEYQWRFRITIY